jgi:hypothetical protein
MRALTGAFMTLAGGVILCSPHAEHVMGWFVVLLGIIICIFGLARPEPRRNSD